MNGNWERLVDWQKIETAPLDGTLVDLWILASGTAFRAADFRWNGSAWAHEHGVTLDQYYANVNMRPTHWMPRPAPPTTA